MSIKDKSAFPSWKVEQANQGMSVREKFAESAMIGILSNNGLTQDIVKRNSSNIYTYQVDSDIFFKQVSRMAVEAADALIAELEKNKESNNVKITTPGIKV